MIHATDSIFLSRTFNCSAQELFNWLITPELIARWFGPKDLSVKDVKTHICVGGSYSIELNKPNGDHFFIQGEYLEIATPHKLVFSFRYEGLGQSPPESVVKMILKQITEHQTSLSLTQKFDTAPLDMEGRTKSWESMFCKLDDEIRTVTDSE